MTDRGLGAWVSRDEPPPSASAAGTEKDPKNVVPAIVLLASDLGADITGRVVGATGNQISIWREPERDQTLYSIDPYWDLDRLFQIMPDTLAAENLEPPAFVLP